MPDWLQVFVVVALLAIVALQLLTLLTIIQQWLMGSPSVERCRQRRRTAQEPAADSAAEEEMLLLLRELAEVFKGWPDAFGVLDEIVAQTKTNTGHSMRDILDRLEEAAIVAATAAETAATAAEDSAAAIRHLSTVTTLGAATGLRIEEHAVGVADDLAASHDRADATGGLVPGEAADAAAQSPARTEHVSNTDSTGENHERP